MNKISIAYISSLIVLLIVAFFAGPVHRFFQPPIIEQVDTVCLPEDRLDEFRERGHKEFIQTLSGPGPYYRCTASHDGAGRQVLNCYTVVAASSDNCAIYLRHMFPKN